MGEQTPAGPTVGRVVHVQLFVDGKPTNDQCFAATVAHVWSPELINVGGYDAEGRPFAATSVSQARDGESVTAGYRWHWPERV